MLPRPVRIIARPTIEPANDAATSASIVRRHPMNAPIIASIFTSPKPSPSSRRINRYASNIAHSAPPPAAMPIKESTQPGATKRLNRKPAAMPGTVTTFGRM